MWRRWNKRYEIEEGDNTMSQRSKMQLCQKCFANPQLAGMSMTPYICKLCGRTKLSGSTIIPKYCFDCGKKLDVCCRCGNSMD